MFDRKNSAVNYAKGMIDEDDFIFIHQADGTMQEVLSAKGPVPTKDGSLRTQPSIHVVPDTDGWAVQSQNNKRPAKHFKSKYGAVRFAHDMADKQGAAMIVHKKNGAISHIDIPPHFKSPLSALLHLR